jgi:ribonucleotide reductase alpha subunit
MQAMPERVREAVRAKGLRNVTLLTVAPTGTTGTMVATSTGVEPYFSWSYFRKSRLGIHEERVAVADEWERANPGKPLPDYFVNAMELTPIEHVNVQAAIQRWVDSAISKTCNVPSEYTIAQTRELYEYMYKMGCKGGTIYRDGSRDEQVLNLKKEEEKAKENGPVASAAVEEKKPAAESAKNPLSALWNKPKIRPRPKLARGVTIKKESPLGSLYVTINDDDEGASHRWSCGSPRRSRRTSGCGRSSTSSRGLAAHARWALVRTGCAHCPTRWPRRSKSAARRRAAMCRLQRCRTGTYRCSWRCRVCGPTCAHNAVRRHSCTRKAACTATPAAIASVEP